MRTYVRRRDTEAGAATYVGRPSTRSRRAPPFRSCVAAVGTARTGDCARRCRRLRRFTGRLTLRITGVGRASIATLRAGATRGCRPRRVRRGRRKRLDADVCPNCVRDAATPAAHATAGGDVGHGARSTCIVDDHAGVRRVTCVVARRVAACANRAGHRWRLILASTQRVADDAIGRSDRVYTPNCRGVAGTDTMRCCADRRLHRRPTTPCDDRGHEPVAATLARRRTRRRRVTRASAAGATLSGARQGAARARSRARGRERGRMVTADA